MKILQSYTTKFNVQESELYVQSVYSLEPLN